MTGRYAALVGVLVWSVTGVPQITTLNVNDYPGADAGAKFSNCVAALPPSGGTCDARSLQGTQTIASDPFKGVTKPITVLLGNATFIYSSEITIPSKSTLQGGGEGVTVLREADSKNLMRSLWVPAGSSNVVLEDFSLDLNRDHNSGPGQDFGIWVGPHTAASTIQRVEVKDFYGRQAGTGVAIALAGTEGVTVQNCKVRHVGYLAELGPSRHQSDGIYTGGNNNTIINNELSEVTDTGIVAENSVNPTITGNVITNSVQGIGLGGGSATARGSGGLVANNKIIGLRWYNGLGIWIYKLDPAYSTSNVVVRDNEIRDFTDGAGIVVRGSRFVSLLRNRLSNLQSHTSAALSGYGIVVENSHDIIIDGGSVSLASLAGLWVRGVSRFSVTGLNVTDNVSSHPGQLAGILVSEGPRIGIISSARHGGFVTVTTGTPHNYAIGDTLVITQAQRGRAGTDFNGTFTICGPTTPGCQPPTPTTFSFTQNAPDDAAAAGEINKLSSDGFIAGNASTGKTQGRGLLITGNSTRLFVGSNDFRYNVNHPGFFSDSTGNIRQGSNLDDTTAQDPNLLTLISGIISGNCGRGMQLGSSATGQVAPGGAADVTVSWPNGFGSSRYSASCLLTGSTGQAVTLRVEAIESKTAGSVTVRVVNDDTASANSGSVQCSAVP